MLTIITNRLIFAIIIVEGSVVGGAGFLWKSSVFSNIGNLQAEQVKICA